MIRTKQLSVLGLVAMTLLYSDPIFLEHETGQNPETSERLRAIGSVLDETGLRGRFEFIVRKDMKITWPRAETPTHWIVMGLSPNLEDAMKMAVRETINFITQRFPKLSREEAYMIASVAVDYHVTQVVDGTKGIHGMIPKAIFTSQ